ncbi:hypothetical protein [Allorhodopirellula heiligendammensis]|uniref:Uncharacterized protein n=1 Tax=Allorhodopirellula heiligendammensis TaxID=2714739 RepID=A0A5C6BTU2_9BACT|nr:hypothetical protein [Allorhodopirellula heiligendammensis]TWU15643.1 hypothetical protein Poly21_28400 [Allorhodopirellula heiligendammensis]
MGTAIGGESERIFIPKQRRTGDRMKSCGAESEYRAAHSVHHETLLYGGAPHASSYGCPPPQAGGLILLSMAKPANRLTVGENCVTSAFDVGDPLIALPYSLQLQHEVWSITLHRSARPPCFD